jgi:hypothetical protein
MALDNWLIEQTQRLRGANNAAEVRALIELLEDRYDAFSGPGEELIEQLLDAARRRLAQLSG